ncbi:hypothetical protein [Bradyrhizobium centrosematis]|uniref:hypothetical protein n=1 Tax=Bradyrhizobium centrosematis TaxID=1300039 RepID=UPI00389055E8
MKSISPDRRERSKVASRFAESALACSKSYFEGERGPAGAAEMAGFDAAAFGWERVSFQVSILKILAGQPDGRASLAVLKHYLAVLYSSGPEWTDRMKRLATRAPDLNIFGQGLITREPGYWIITEDGRTFLALLEQMGVPASEVRPLEGDGTEKPLPTKPSVLASGRHGHSVGRRHRRNKRERTRDGRST